MKKNKKMVEFNKKIVEENVRIIEKYFGFEALIKMTDPNRTKNKK